MLQLSKEEAIDFYSLFFYGENHFPSYDIKPFGYGWAMPCTKPLASTDYNELTRLIILAHDHCLRVELIPKGMNRYLLALTKRERVGGWATSHQTMEQAIESHRNAMRTSERFKDRYRADGSYIPLNERTNAGAVQQ